MNGARRMMAMFLSLWRFLFDGPLSRLVRKGLESSAKARRSAYFGPPLQLATRMEIAHELTRRWGTGDIAVLVMRHRTGRWSFHHNVDTSERFPVILRELARMYEESEIETPPYDQNEEME